MARRDDSPGPSTNGHNGQSPTAREVLKLIRAMSPQERLRLVRALDSNRGLLGGWEVHMPGHGKFIVWSTGILCEEIRRLTHLVVECSNEAWRYQRASRTKKERLARRHALIDQLLAAKITEPEEILKSLLEQAPELVRKGKKGCISAELMMRTYWRSKEDREEDSE
jgi:hypothetical protein